MSTYNPIYVVNVCLSSTGKYVAETTDEVGYYCGEGSLINEAIFELFQNLPVSVLGRTFQFRYI